MAILGTSITNGQEQSNEFYFCYYFGGEGDDRCVFHLRKLIELYTDVHFNKKLKNLYKMQSGKNRKTFLNQVGISNMKTHYRALVIKKMRY